MEWVQEYRRRIKSSLRDCHLKLSLGLCLFEEGFSFDFFGFFISLPFLDRYAYDPHEIVETWGISYFHDECSIHCRWGIKYKIINLPWQFDFVKGSHHIQRGDGSWVEYIGKWDVVKGDDNRYCETYPYKYVLKNGEVQNLTATVFKERREWRRRFLKWCPWFAKKRVSIDVEFSGEVGERSGSWKGGCTACGYDIKSTETMCDALSRMERERKF